MVLGWYQKYSMKYIYNTSQISKLSLILHTFRITSLVASLFLADKKIEIHEVIRMSNKNV